MFRWRKLPLGNPNISNGMARSLPALLSGYHGPTGKFLPGTRDQDADLKVPCILFWYEGLSGIVDHSIAKYRFRVQTMGGRLSDCAETDVGPVDGCLGWPCPDCCWLHDLFFTGGSKSAKRPQRAKATIKKQLLRAVARVPWTMRPAGLDLHHFTSLQWTRNGEGNRIRDLYPRVELKTGKEGATKYGCIVQCRTEVDKMRPPGDSRPSSGQ